MKETRPQLDLDYGFYIEYVPGPHPYYWVGDDRGHFVGTVDVSELRAFVMAPFKFAERAAAGVPGGADNHPGGADNQ